jgi:hypothetical protein
VRWKQRAPWLALAFAVLAAACSGPSGTDQLASRVSNPRIVGAAHPSDATVTYTCDVKVRGESPEFDEAPAEWQTRSLLVGPLGLLDKDLLANEPPAAFGPAGRGYNARIMVVVLEAGASATLVVPQGARESVLLFDALSPPGSPPYDLVEGVATIRFEACADRDTPFGYAVLPIGPQCVPLDVFTHDPFSSTRVSLSFGAGACPEVSASFTG